MKYKSISINLVRCIKRVAIIIYKDSPGDTYPFIQTVDTIRFVSHTLTFTSKCRLLLKFFN